MILGQFKTAPFGIRCQATERLNFLYHNRPPSRSGVCCCVCRYRLALARVSVLRGQGPHAGTAFIDDYVASVEPVVDYLTRWSGIRPGTAIQDLVFNKLADGQFRMFAAMLVHDASKAMSDYI